MTTLQETNQPTMIITIKKEIDLDRLFLEDVFMTALEGGSNYWYWIADEQVEKVRKAVPKSKQPYFSIAVLEAVMIHGIDVAISDKDDHDNTLGVISKKTMRSRIQSMADSEQFSHMIQAQLDEMGDSNTADCIFQYIVMGEVMFG